MQRAEAKGEYGLGPSVIIVEKSDTSKENALKLLDTYRIRSLDCHIEEILDMLEYIICALHMTLDDE